MMADATVLIDRLLDLALEEDIGTGDVTSLYFVPAEERAEARIFAKEAGVVAGSEVCEAVFRKVDPFSLWRGCGKTAKRWRWAIRS